MVRADTAQLADGARSLLDVAHALLDVRTSLGSSSRSCASDSGEVLGAALGRFGVAATGYTDLLGQHLLSAGWLAENLAGDLDAATGGPDTTGAG
jgi:hypothetical protein